VFGIGVQEMVIIGLRFLVTFGSNERPVMARDFRRFVSGARHQLDEYKSEITSAEEENQKDHHRES
jgi:Sec-independent protein translocase protein TatA